RGALNETHRAGVDEHMLDRNVGELVGDDASDGLPPEARRLEHVGFVDRGDAAAPRTGKLGGDANDPFDLARRRHADVGSDLAITGGRALEALLAEIDTAGELADDENVDAR